jgi:hypothetical protein
MLTHQRRFIRQTKPQAVALAAILACTASLLLRIVPAFYPSVSLLDARNVVFAGSNALIYSLGAKNPAQVRVLFLYDLLADILLLSAIWLALSRQAFMLHDAFRNGGHTLVPGHYWRIFSPIAGWSCAVVAVIAIPCTELLMFLLFDCYVTSIMGSQAIALPSPLDNSSQSFMLAEHANLNDNTGSMLTTGAGWALARIVIGIWCIAYSIAGFIIAQATFRRRAEMFSRRNQATVTSHLALSLQDNCRVFVQLFALPITAFSFALMAGIQAGFVFWHEAGGYWQLAFTSIASATMFFMYLLLICSFSINICPSRPLATLTSSGMTTVVYGTSRPQTFHDNPDILCQQMSDVNTHMQHLYSSGLALPPLVDSIETIENNSSENNDNNNMHIIIGDQPRDTILTVNSLELTSTNIAQTNNEIASTKEQHKTRHGTIERGLSSSIASLIDILPSIPRRLIYNSFTGRQVQSNEAMRRSNNSHSNDNAYLDRRHRSLSLPSIPILPSHIIQSNLSLAPALHEIRSSSGIDGNAYIENYRHSVASPSLPDSIRQLQTSSNLLHSHNHIAHGFNDSVAMNQEIAHTSYYGPSRLESTTQYNTPIDRSLHTAEERVKRFRWPSTSSISVMVATATGRHPRSSTEQSPTQPEFTHTSNEQMSSLLMDETGPAYLALGRHTNDDQYLHSQPISHVASSQTLGYTRNYETPNNNNGSDINKNQELEPFSFVVPPPVQRRTLSNNSMSSRSFPSHTPQHTSMTNVTQHLRIRQISLPSLPRMEAFGTRQNTVATLSSSKNNQCNNQSITPVTTTTTTYTGLNRAIVEQSDHCITRITQPRSSARVTFLDYPSNEGSISDVQQQQPAHLVRRRIDRGSYSGLDLSPFGNGDVNERSDKDESITENTLL